MFALMMRCRTGTRYLYGEAWHDVMTTITVSGHPTEIEAYQEAVRLAPRGFNRERISLWVVPWNERFA
jgi:hypothetical protein